MRAINDNKAPSDGGASPDVPSGFRFLSIPFIDRVALYWPLSSDTQARCVLRDLRAVPTGLDSRPADSMTRHAFGNARVGLALVTFAAYARIVAAGYAEPIHRA